MTLRTLACALACVAIPISTFAVDVPPGPIVVGPFSSTIAGSMPAAWTTLLFRGIDRHTRYETIADAERGTVVMAVSDRSASALIRRTDIDPQQHPLLRWQWKIDNVLQKSDVTRRDGDDYPARIYVSFKYDPARVSWFNRAAYAAIRLIYGEYPPHAGLNYIWDSKAPRGTIVPNPHTSRVAMVVVETGADHVREWRSYGRNLVEDYRRAFGEEPPPISGIAIMTDTDNTGESARAWYGDIVLSPSPGAK